VQNPLDVEPGWPEMEAAVTNGGSHADIAKVFNAIYGARFKWAATRNHGIIYEFNGNTWELQEDNAVIHNLLTEYISKMFRKLGASYTKSRDDEEDAGAKNILMSKSTLENRLATCLGNTTFVAHVITAISKTSYEADFLERLDTNLDLLAFKNGVIDLAWRRKWRGNGGHGVAAEIILRPAVARLRLPASGQLLGGLPRLKIHGLLNPDRGGHTGPC
jgi:hypothetical protein